MKNIIFQTGLLCLFLSFTSFAQMRNFTLFPSRVDVTTTAITSPAAALPGFSPEYYSAGSGAYENGSNTPIFTIRDLDIYNANGVWMAALPIEPGYDNIRVHGEIAIVAVPGSCRKYYVVYSLYGPTTTVTLKAVVNAQNPNSIVVESPGLLISGSNYSMSGALAVSKRNGAGNHDLYLVWSNSIKKFSVTASGITYVSEFGIPVIRKVSELELSNDGAYLSWGEYTTAPILYRVSVSGTGLMTKTLSSAICGVEFHSTNSNIVFASTGGATLTKIDFTTTPVSTSIALPINWLCNSHLEQDGLNRIFGINSNNTLFYIDQNNTSVPAVNTSIVVYSSNFVTPTLNDQIDGADYSNFSPVHPPTIAPSFTINGSSSTGFIPVSFNSPVTAVVVANPVETNYFLSIMPVDQNMNSIGTEHAQWFNGAAGTIDIFNFYAVKTGQKFLSPGNYKVKIAYGGGACSTWEESSKYITVSCNAVASMTMNGSVSLTYIPVPYNTPVTLDGTASTGETTYRISMRAVDLYMNPIGPEYAQIYMGTAGVISMNAFYTSKTGKSIIPPGYYKIKLILSNDKDGGCTNGEEITRWIEIGCKPVPYMTVNGSTSQLFIPVPYNSPVKADATASTGEADYFVSILPMDFFMNATGPELSQWYSGTAGIININAFYTAKTGLSIIPPGYYKIKLAVANLAIGGCSGWEEFAQYIQVQNGVRRISDDELNELESTTTVSIHPNPVEENLNIMIADKNSLNSAATLQVFNMQGDELYNQELSTNTEYSIPLSIPAGLYVGVITEENGNVQKVKIVKVEE